MGCSSSKVDPTQQFRLMRLAQSRGLFLSSEAARQALTDSPGVSPDQLIEQLESTLRPRRAVLAGERQSTNEELRRAALAVADTSMDSNQSAEHPPPVPTWHLDDVTPSMLPSEIPEQLRLHVSEEEDICVICACPLLGESSSEGSSSTLSVRQLLCSHAFHTICVDAWLTEQAGSCPLCLAAYPRPACEEPHNCRAKYAYDNFRLRMANGGREELAEHQREQRERIEEAGRREREIPIATLLVPIVT